jgi:hypothetical protein
MTDSPPISRRPARVSQADIARAVKGAKAPGFEVGRLEIDASGKIVLIAGPPETVEPKSPLEAWKAGRSARAP